MMKEELIREGIPKRITRDDVDGVHIKYIKKMNNTYAVSDEGYVYSFSEKSKGKIVGSKYTNGYCVVALRYSAYGKCHTISKYVHQVVAEAFIKNPKNKNQIHHINEIKIDNRACNLQYCSAKENCNAGNHNMKQSQSHAHINNVATPKRVVIENHVFSSIAKAAEFIYKKTGKNINASRNQISRIINNKVGVKTVGGFEVRELTEEEYNNYKKKVKSTSQQSSPKKN